MFRRQTTGSVVCPQCGRLVGVNDERCHGCGKWNPSLWGFAPLLGKLGQHLGFMELVLGVCTILFLVSLIYAPRPMPESASLGALFDLLSPELRSLYRFGASGGVPFFVVGRWWTILSAGWLHGGLFHIFMNMWALRQLVPAVAHFYGTSRAVILYVASSAAGFLLTSFAWLLAERLSLPGILQGAPFTIGASAALLGMCGALIYAGRRGSASSELSRQILQWVAILFVIGLLVPIVDNWAHLGGLAGGYLMARWLDPMKPETPGHAVAALVCLALTALSLIASFVAGPRWEQLFGG